MSFANNSQLQELASYMGGQINLTSISSGGYAPIGTIISFMGVSAPSGFLICDGSVYQIGLYPHLARFFEDQFGQANYFGGDGSTTFAVPDLRGEFLRGAGVNSHTNQGSGSNVGTHQNATEHSITTVDNSTYALGERHFQSESGISRNARNIDANIAGQTKIFTTTSQSASGGNDDVYFASRPTNTSVLYCIKASVDILDMFKYSTQEQVVGTWIDGKPIYQRIWDFETNFRVEPDVWFTFNLSDIDATSFEFLIEARAFHIRPARHVYTLSDANIESDGRVWIKPSGIIVFDAIMLQYTKITD